MSEELARKFYELYERLAPSYGYETRPETKAFDPTSNNGRLMIAVTDELLAEQTTLKAENGKLRAWIHDLQSGMYVNCVYCGHRYGPKENTPETQADILKAHIEVCPKHPLSEARCETKAWKETAAQQARDVTYYQGLLDKIGLLFGEAAHISDDGSRQDSIIRAKIPELVTILFQGVASEVARVSTGIPTNWHTAFLNIGKICREAPSLMDARRTLKEVEVEYQNQPKSLVYALAGFVLDHAIAAIERSLNGYTGTDDTQQAD